MKCDHCDNEATVHEVTVHNGVRVERNLCEQCAAQQGVAMPGMTGMPGESLVKHVLEPLVQAAVSSLSPTAPGSPAASACPRCGTTFAQFKQSGLLGCPACYRALETQLLSLVERAHEGATQHVGKSPARLLSGATRAPEADAPEEAAAAQPGRAEIITLDAQELDRRRQTLRSALEQAINAEQYERAAQIRDELRRLSDAPGGKAQSGD